MRRISPLLGSLLLLLPGTQGGDDALASLERQLTAAWSHAQTEDVELLRDQLEAHAREHPEAARAHYLLGLAELMPVILTNGSPDSTNSDATLEALDRAEAHLASAYALDPGEADACATIAFCILQRFMLGQAAPEQGPLMAEWVQKGQAADADRVSVRVLSLWLEGSRGMLPDDQTDAWMKRFVALGESILDGVLEKEEGPAFWDLFGLALVGRALVFSPRPLPREAARLTDAALELDPDFHMARAFLLPFVTERETLAPETFADLEWADLGVELEPDGGMPGLPDAAAVSFARVEDDLWVNVQLVDPPNEKLFGINLVVDADGDPENGVAWWGGNSSFRFDRLVSVWVNQDDEGTYHGAVGVTDDVGAYPGEMTKLGDGNVGFAVDREAPAFVLRVPWKALGGGNSVRLVVAVGSNVQWNDDLPGEGGFVVEK